MRFYFLFFTFLILSAGLISAATLSGSPSSLNFNLDIGEEKCLIFVVSSSDYSGDLNSIMKWAEKDAEVSSPNDFIFDSSEVGLNVVYSPESITNFDGEEEISVCISGSEEGYWRGSLKYITESEGNTGIGIGTWLRVNITNIPNQEPQTTTTNTNSNSGGSSGGGGGSSSSSTIKITENTTTSEENTEIEETPLGELEEFGEESSGITGAVIGFAKTKTGKITIGIILAIIIFLVGIKIYKKNFIKK